VRINVGLEDVGDLKADLAQSLQALGHPRAEGRPHG
jgi:cystathionine beta-lyase/cystathionine gamma-synthase